MDEQIELHLSGGILFAFLVYLHSNTARQLNTSSTSKKSIRNHDLMENLIWAIYPSYKRYNDRGVLQTTVSNYLTCKANGGNILPFESNLVVMEEFDKSVKMEYEVVLGRMKEFTDKSFPECNDEPAICFFIQSILALIHKDNSIKTDDLFYINEDGSPISKNNILQKEEFNFQSFLVGIWHYIINKPIKNISGRETFTVLFPECINRKWTIDTHHLKPFPHDISITELEISGRSSSKEIHRQENILETTKTNKNEKLALRIFYKEDSLDKDVEEQILSNSAEIIDLNEHPDISLKNFSNFTIFKITTEFQFKPRYSFFGDKDVILYFSVGSSKISGTTSAENWLNRSRLNEMIGSLKYSCTAWFTLDPLENRYSAKFHIIGKVRK